jgi:hypothetical protein
LTCLRSPSAKSSSAIDDDDDPSDGSDDHPSHSVHPPLQPPRRPHSVPPPSPPWLMFIHLRPLTPANSASRILPSAARLASKPLPPSNPNRPPAATRTMRTAPNLPLRKRPRTPPKSRSQNPRPLSSPSFTRKSSRRYRSLLPNIHRRPPAYSNALKTTT